MRNPQDQRTTWTRDLMGCVTREFLGNGTRASILYDDAGSILKLSNFATAAVISTFDYKYDGVGNPTRVAEAGGIRNTWTYDKIYQLRRERRNGATAYDVTHSYDAVGNRLVKNDSGTRTTVSYDAANQILVAQTASSRTTFSHDGAGNRTRQNAAGSLTSLAWDVDSRMRRTVVPAGTIQTIAYTGDHNRVSQQDGSGTSRYIWDGPSLLTETDSGGTTQAEYTQGQNPPGETFGELLSQRRGSTTTSYAHFDAMGTTDRLTNSSQTVTDSYVLGAFGEQRSASGGTTNPHRFVGESGYYQDASTGFYYVRRRWYDPATARWMSEGPVGSLGEDARGYRYSANRPLVYDDPSGMQSEPDDVAELAEWLNPSSVAQFGGMFNEYASDAPSATWFGNPIVTASIGAIAAGGFFAFADNPSPSGPKKEDLSKPQPLRKKTKKQQAKAKKKQVKLERKDVNRHKTKGKGKSLPTSNVHENARTTSPKAKKKKGWQVKRFGGSRISAYGVGLTALWAWNEMAGTACAAEVTNRWRDNYYYRDRKCQCACAVYIVTVTVPDFFLQIFEDPEYGEPTLHQDWDDKGYMTGPECRELEGFIARTVVEDVQGYTIYNELWRICVFGGEDEYNPEEDAELCEDGDDEIEEDEEEEDGVACRHRKIAPEPIGDGPPSGEEE